VNMVAMALRDELLRRMERDQAVRAKVASGEWTEEIAKECFAVDADNTAFLKDVGRPVRVAGP
jgi:hypothetical protein